nr:SDR family NAD(P)-dependent oxidoreductase [Acetobacter oeni]
MFSVAGKVAVVTGGGRGLGRAMSLHLAACGARVRIGRRDGEQLRSVCDEAAARGWSVSPFRLDVSCLSSVRAAFSALAGEVSCVDILVNNAGVEDVRASDDVDEALWDRLVDTNLRGAFFVAQQAARLMKQGRFSTLMAAFCRSSEKLYREV